MFNFNARIGQDCHQSENRSIGKHIFHDKTNKNIWGGKKLISLCSKFSLRSTQLLFSHPANRQWSWLSPKGLKTHIDHILIRSKWVNSVTNCRSYFTVQVGSDHRIVTAYFKTSLRCTKPNNIRSSPTLDWKELSNNPILQYKYSIEVSNKFNLLSKFDDHSSSQNDYNNFMKCFNEANKIIPLKKRQNKTNWISNKSDKLKKQRDTAKLSFIRNRNDTNYQKMKSTLLIKKN